MAKRTKRDDLKRKVAQSYHSVDKALESLQELYQVFDGVHPEYCEGLELASQLFIQGQKVLEQFALSAWNLDKDRLLKHRTQ